MLPAAERVRVLRSLALFSGLSDADLELIAAKLTEASVEKGSTIFRAGDPGDSMFLLVRGKVAIRDRARLLVTISAPECFGELAVLSRDERSADAICEESCELLKLRANDLHDLLATRPALQHQMMLALVRRVKEVGSRR